MRRSVTLVSLRAQSRLFALAADREINPLFFRVHGSAVREDKLFEEMGLCDIAAARDRASAFNPPRQAWIVRRRFQNFRRWRNRRTA